MLNNIFREFELTRGIVKFYLQKLENGSNTIILSLNGKVVYIGKYLDEKITELEKNKGIEKAIYMLKDCLLHERNELSEDYCFTDKQSEYKEIKLTENYIIEDILNAILD